MKHFVGWLVLVLIAEPTLNMAKWTNQLAGLFIRLSKWFSGQFRKVMKLAERITQDDHPLHPLH